MDNRDRFHRQAALVVRALPFVARREEFALKGGTAINLFLRNLPRFSVDIDLTYLPLGSRAESLRAARNGLLRIAEEVKRAIPALDCGLPDPHRPSALRLTLTLAGSRIKVEASPVMRGAVWPPETRHVTAVVEEVLGYSENRLLSFDDLYAGKMCAALDRQHPRDLFDIALLLANEGISRRLLKTFLVYLISHNRPIAELLAPRRPDIRQLYEDEFEPMARHPLPFDRLISAREELVAAIHHGLTDADREFLVSVKNRRPRWNLLGLPGIADLPAVQWKLLNLGRMSASRHAAAVARLRRVLEVGSG